MNKLKQCDTNWTAVATIVNQMGGNKDKQNDVISQVLKIKKEYNKKKKENKKTTYKAKNILKQLGVNTKASDQDWLKAGSKVLLNK